MTVKRMPPEKIKRWMRRELSHHTNDYLVCGEINSTLLGENFANEFEYYEDDDCKIPELIFDIAADVSLKWEKENTNV